MISAQNIYLIRPLVCLENCPKNVPGTPNTFGLFTVLQESFEGFIKFC